MRLPLSIIFSSIFTVISCFTMFHVKFKVQNLSRDIAEIRKQTDIEHESIRVLKAEWAYLNKPQRLRQIVARYLPNVKPITLAQIGINNKQQNDEFSILFTELEKNENKPNNLSKITYSPDQ